MIRNRLAPTLGLVFALGGCAGAQSSSPSGASDAPAAVERRGEPTEMRIPGASGRFEVYEAFRSRHVLSRRVVVWLPPGYESSTERYAVLYMHDGQNLFDPRTAMGGETWGVEQHLATLLRERRIRPTIVVGIDNTRWRSREYAPAGAVARLPAQVRPLVADGDPRSDEYVRFLVEELKPFVDARYRTRPGRDDTFVMGSSMGGLISLYALASRPDVFGGAGCLSTHWPLTGSGELLGHEHGRPPDARVATLAASYRDWLREHLPRAGAHRLYFDHGTEHLDAVYPPLQAEVDVLLRDKGYGPRDLLSRAFPGTYHNEAAWRARLDVPLEFLLRER